MREEREVEMERMVMISERSYLSNLERCCKYYFTIYFFIIIAAGGTMKWLLLVELRGTNALFILLVLCAAGCML